MLAMLHATLCRSTSLLQLSVPLGRLLRQSSVTSALNSTSDTRNDTPAYINKQKVTIVGADPLAASIAFALLVRGITNDLCFMSCGSRRMQGEMLDLLHGSVFLNDPKISCSDDFATSANSRICIVTANVQPQPGQSRRELLQYNADFILSNIPPLVEHSPETILLINTHPVDIMTYIAWRASNFPVNRVLGSGTALDSARFRYFIAQRLGLATNSCHAYIIGEQGNSSVPVWSGVRVAGIRLCALNRDIGTNRDKEQWYLLHHQVVQELYEVIKYKGYSNWGTALSVATLVAAILGNTRQIHPVSVAAKGFHGIQEGVFLSLPSVLAANGIASIVQQTLSKNELILLKNCAEVLAKMQSNIDLHGVTAIKCKS